MTTPASSYAATDGAAYDVFLGRWTQRLSEPFLDFIDPPDGALLDVGCGTGSLARAMAKRWPARRISGADIAPSYVAFATERSGGAIEFATADACQLPHGNASFAATAAQLVLNFVSDPRRALAEMMRVTQRGGI